MIARCQQAPGPRRIIYASHNPSLPVAHALLGASPHSCRFRELSPGVAMSGDAARNRVRAPRGLPTIGWSLANGVQPRSGKLTDGLRPSH